MVKLPAHTNEQFIVLAINTAEDDYHLAWLLNLHLSIELARVKHPGFLSNAVFSIFRAKEPSAKLTYTLVKTLVEGKSLLPPLKNVDFIFKISGILTVEEADRILSTIRSIDQIYACIRVNSCNSNLLSFFSLF